MLNYYIPLKSSVPKLHVDDAILRDVFQNSYSLNCGFRRNKTKLMWI